MPTRWPDAVPRETLTFDVMPDLQAVRAGGWRVQLGAAELEADGAHRWMVDTYARMPGALGGAVREAARRLAGGPPKTDAPAQTRLLVHCNARKDRTGFVVAMLLAALVPPPRMHLTRFHGVFAAHSRLRAAITPAGRPRQEEGRGRQGAERDGAPCRDELGTASAARAPPRQGRML
jgi:hypothetical protein